MYPGSYTKDLEEQITIYNRSSELYKELRNLRLVAERMQLSYEKLMYIRKKIKGEIENGKGKGNV